MERSRAVIVEEARQQFLAHGFQAVNLDEVARRARVSKRTIYNHFGDKEQLFRAILSDVVATAERFADEALVALDGADDLEAELRRVTVRLAQVVVSRRVVSVRRLLVAEAGRFPELARDYYGRAPGKVMDAVAGSLERLGRGGALRIGDPALAAEHLVFLAFGAALDRALFTADLDDLPPGDEIERRAGAGVDAFLRAYRR